jgi:hypothetical protein
MVLNGVMIAGPDAPILGRSVIVHANPARRNAGGRIGCGVIELKPQVSNSG